MNAAGSIQRLAYAESAHVTSIPPTANKKRRMPSTSATTCRLEGDSSGAEFPLAIPPVTEAQQRINPHCSRRMVGWRFSIPQTKCHSNAIRPARRIPTIAAEMLTTVMRRAAEEGAPRHSAQSRHNEAAVPMESSMKHIPIQKASPALSLINPRGDLKFVPPVKR